MAVSQLIAALAKCPSDAVVCFITDRPDADEVAKVYRYRVSEGVLVEEGEVTYCEDAVILEG